MLEVDGQFMHADSEVVVFSITYSWCNVLGVNADLGNIEGTRC